MCKRKNYSKALFGCEITLKTIGNQTPQHYVFYTHYSRPNQLWKLKFNKKIFVNRNFSQVGACANSLHLREMRFLSLSNSRFTSLFGHFYFDSCGYNLLIFGLECNRHTRQDKNVRNNNLIYYKLNSEDMVLGIIWPNTLLNAHIIFTYRANILFLDCKIKLFSKNKK